MPNDDFRSVIAGLPRAICEAQMQGSHALIGTGVMYPNGISASVRVDWSGSRYIVSDDGYAAHIADTMGTGPALNRIAASCARRDGIAFEKRTFVLFDVTEETLASAVSVVANTSARAVERMNASLEKPRLRHSRSIFDKRLQAAYGNRVQFNLEFHGATGRSWSFDAGVEEDGRIVRLYELVAASTQAVAIANMKIMDTQALDAPPGITTALVDYDATEPALRSILSNAGSIVIPANADVALYLAAA